MPTEDQNLKRDIDNAFLARYPVQDQLAMAQRRIDKLANNLRRTVVEVHARTVTEYRNGQHPDDGKIDEPYQYIGVKLVMLVMEVEEASASQSLDGCLRLRGLKLGPRGGLFPWVEVWQHDISALYERDDVKKLLEGIQLYESPDDDDPPQPPKSPKPAPVPAGG